ncbi:uncharacterized protein LOC129952764 [Eupeodes corollae]|uniref:uncharacterized protein LOC129952764 n=1 Tax=Eupeodes corollae TaxID=290404 RepID=UPI002493CB7D|nr:uncharacterized protein LOC129952764 [Eupeodes corollae]
MFSGQLTAFSNSGTSSNGSSFSKRRMSKKQTQTNFIQEFIDLGHMEKVTQSPTLGKHYYMPHRAVTKDTSTTTKLRVVFNASCRTTTGFSLNDTKMIGPQLQPDLYMALIRMRTYRFALTADVAKMYRQVRINPNQVDYQRIVWRNSPEDDVEDYRILTVTYGVASSSHFAIKAIQQATLDEEKNHPVPSNVIMNHFYTDDLLTGSYYEEELNRIRTDVSAILMKGGFSLREWSFNSSLVNFVPEDQRKVLPPLDFSDADGIRTLGHQRNLSAINQDY